MITHSKRQALKCESISKKVSPMLAHFLSTTPLFKLIAPAELVWQLLADSLSVD